MRQRSGQPGEEEPVDAEGDHHQDEQREAVVGGGDDRCGGEHREDAHQVASEQDLPTAPSVEEDAGERTEQAERQQHCCQGGGDAARVGLSFRREQDVRRERRLKDPVGALAGDAHGEQSTKPRVAQQAAQIADGSHDVAIVPDPLGSAPVSHPAGGGRFE